MILYAHTQDGVGEDQWELLCDHHSNVANHSGELAAKFGAGEPGRLLGRLHDHGKAKPAVQTYLRAGPPEPHSIEGAREAMERFPGPLGRMLAFCIAGHHAGLANGKGEGGGLTPLDDRLQNAERLAWPFDEADLEFHDGPPPPALGEGRDEFAISFFIRMLFSCLGDADSLETEKFYAALNDEPIQRGWSGNLGQLQSRLDRHLAKFSSPGDDVACLRAQVLAACRKAALQSPGLFSLTVPTGGGKTLSSLAFGLDHAVRHGLDRVIYVAPFTSIIEQTAGVFRQALRDDDAILEHHSAFDVEERFRDFKSEQRRNGRERLRLAAQNWDRPIVVTTAVQFFESLFANKKSRCRKLHNIARSVIVLDEAQTIPPKVLRPCLKAISELARGYGSTIVLCTATQPAVVELAENVERDALQGVRLANVHEIMANPKELFSHLDRVRTDSAGVLSDDAVVARMLSADQAMCIVNNRRHARELFESLEKQGAQGVCHLTTAMTGAHRRAKLDEIRERLCRREPVRLVATSLVEAGVDISFALVLRAMAGLESIAQAAGRCNRGGELGKRGGLTVIFQPEDIEGRAPPPELRQFADAASAVMEKHEDPLALDAVQAYFRELYFRKGSEELDALKFGERETKGALRVIKESCGGEKLNFRFADIGAGFRLIENAMVPVIIPATDNNPYGAPKEVMKRLHYAKDPGGIARDLQRFVVQVPRSACGDLIAKGAARTIREEEFGGQFVLLVNNDLYDAERGLSWTDPIFTRTESLII